MKIGILTHQYINNYGSFLQAYALREAIAKLFPHDEVQIIDYVNVKHFLINTGGWFRFYIKRENLKCWRTKIQIPEIFARERKRKMVLSPRCFTARQINKLCFDCIVVGSDEVWNYKDLKGKDPVKFGEGLDCKNLIAYGTSVGKSAVDDNLPAYVIRGITRFKMISTRDDLTDELVEKVTTTVPLRVLDPTFLCDFPKAELKVKQKPYILFYYCEHLPKKVLDQIFDFAAMNGFAVYGAGDYDKRYTEISASLTPFEWIEMFRNAEFVLTGTFHGVVFSVLHKRQFKIFLSNESRVQKVHALLRELGIEGCEIDENFLLKINDMRCEINYDSVYKIIEEKREQSVRYLRESIQQVFTK